MTPTREQLATLLEEVKRCIYHPQPAEEDNARKKLDHVIACIAALPPPADPQLAPTLPKSMADHVVGMDRDGNLLVKVSNMNAAGNTDTGIYAFSLPRPADPPALVALARNISMTARRALSFGHQATPQTPERMIERKDEALRAIADLCADAGAESSVLRAAPPVPETLLERAWFCLRCRTQVPVTDVWQESRDGQAEPLYTHHVKDGHVVARIDRWTRVPETPQGWTPEYIKSALARAYPQQIQVGDVIEFAHGDDPPMFQRLVHPAAVEDWNGKLRNRVRGIYRPIAAPAVP